MTAPLTEGVILDGVTRRSVLDLARTQRLNALEVVEKKLTMVEAFVVGTAVSVPFPLCRSHGWQLTVWQYFVVSVSHIHYRGRDLKIPVPTTGGACASFFKITLKDIMYGKRHHKWGVIVGERTAS